MGTRFLDRARQQNTYEHHVCLRVDLPISTIVPVDGAYRTPDVNNQSSRRAQAGVVFLERYEWIIEFAGSGNAEARN